MLSVNTVQDATVTHYTQYTVGDLTDVASRLNTMLTDSPHKSLKSILLKYSHQYVQDVISGIRLKVLILCIRVTYVFGLRFTA